MKLNQLTLLLFSLLFSLSSCEKAIENEDFLQTEWKMQSIVFENERQKAPSEHIEKNAYVLKFENDSCFYLPTSVNEARGKYQFVSDRNIIINEYREWTKKGSLYHDNFDDQLLFVFNRVTSYSHTKNKLIFRGEQNIEVVFVKHDKN